MQLIAVTIAVFFLIRALPADPASRLVGLNASPESYRQAKESLGLDKPVLKQLGLYLGFFPGERHGLLQGNLGTSWVTGSPVASEVGRFFPITLELVTYSFLIALLLAVPVGVIASLRPGGFADRCIYVYGLFAGAQPEFWWGLMFVYLFYFRWHLAPAPLGRLDPLTSEPPRVTGALTIDSLIAGKPAIFVQAAHHLMLPVLTLAFVISGPMIKMVRQNMSRVMESDFILYARSSGLPERRVAAYTLRSAFAPTLTLIGILYGYMIGGAVLIEQVFSLGGLGQYAVRSILAFDYPAIQAVVLTITAFSLFVYLLLDLVHALLDPRITR